MYPLVLRCWTFIRRLAPASVQADERANNKTESLNFRCWQPKDIEFIDYTNYPIENLCPLALPYIFQGGV